MFPRGNGKGGQLARSCRLLMTQFIKLADDIMHVVRRGSQRQSRSVAGQVIARRDRELALPLVLSVVWPIGGYAPFRGR